MTTDEARKVLQELWRNEREDYRSLEVREAIDRAIRELQRPSGHWTRLEGGSWGCNKCWSNDKDWNTYNFCPICGADMRGVM